MRELWIENEAVSSRLTALGRLQQVVAGRKRPEVVTQLLCETRAAKSTVELKKTVHSETGVSLGKLG